MKKWTSIVLRVTITIALGAVVFYLVDVGRLLEEFRAISASVIAAILCLKIAATLIAVLRWKRILNLLGTNIGLKRLTADTLVAHFYNQLLPTAVGGDVVRAYRSAKFTPHASHAWAAILYERIVGAFCLGLIPALGLLLSPYPVPLIRLFVFLAVLGSLLALLVGHLPFGLLELIIRRLIPQAADFCREIADLLSGPLSKIRAQLEIFGWSLLYQLVTLLILIVVACDFDAPSIVIPILIGVPVSLFLAMIPITFGGLGLRELLFVAVLAEFGVTKEQALVLAAIWLGTTLLGALAGLAVMATEQIRTNGLWYWR